MKTSRSMWRRLVVFFCAVSVFSAVVVSGCSLAGGNPGLPAKRAGQAEKK